MTPDTSPRLDVITGAQALIVQHHAVFGRLARSVTSFTVGTVEPRADDTRAVTVSFEEPRKQMRSSVRMVADDTRYLTVEVAGTLVYDSRQDVPCDMTRWQETKLKFPQPPFSSHRPVVLP